MGRRTRSRRRSRRRRAGRSGHSGLPPAAAVAQSAETSPRGPLRRVEASLRRAGPESAAGHVVSRRSLERSFRPRGREPRSHCLETMDGEPTTRHHLEWVVRPTRMRCETRSMTSRPSREAPAPGMAFIPGGAFDMGDGTVFSRGAPASFRYRPPARQAETVATSTARVPLQRPLAVIPPVEE